MNNSNVTDNIWLDGSILSIEDANISPLTHGLHYGTGAFEGIRVYNGNIFKLQQHLERFLNSSKILLMEFEFSIEELTKACEKIIKLNNITEGYLRPLVFLGSQSMVMGADNKVHVMIISRTRPSPYLSNLVDKKSLSLNISSTIKPSPESFPYKAKASGLYLLNHIAKKRAIAQNYDDSLMLDYRNFIAEATTSNFFIVKNKMLYTPTTECCLDGITRRTIIEIAKENNISVFEKHLTLEDIETADEAFLCGTAAEMNAISSIENKKFSNNPMSQFLYSKFYQLTQNL